MPLELKTENYEMHVSPPGRMLQICIPDLNLYSEGISHYVAYNELF